MALNVSAIPRATLALVLFALAVLFLGGFIARFARGAQAAVGAAI